MKENKAFLALPHSDGPGIVLGQTYSFAHCLRYQPRNASHRMWLQMKKVPKNGCPLCDGPQNIAKGWVRVLEFKEAMFSQSLVIATLSNC